MNADNTPTHDELLDHMQHCRKSLLRQRKRLPWIIWLLGIMIPINIACWVINRHMHSSDVYFDLLMTLAFLAYIVALWLMYRRIPVLVRELDEAIAREQAMKAERESLEMRSFYDFSEGMRGKYCRESIVAINGNASDEDSERGKMHPRNRVQ